MARLNEPPAVAPASSSSGSQPATESVDALKRRFVRQNRELAKNNSNQSLRIRSLEIEISRLLADNLDLRERILQLQNELDSARSQQISGDAVRRVREELQAKLAELSRLVDGIDALAHTAGDEAKDVPRTRKPIEGQWRERQPLTEAIRESQMPTITEDKQYPRRTMGADEIQAIRLSDHSSNESPDLGPPPIAHFDYEDPVKHVSPSTKRTSPKTAEEDELPASLSVNLETRRRRKDGQPKLEIRRHSVLSQSPTKNDSEPSTILRTGAKRKLADRDLDKPIKPPAKGDFTFSRKASASDSKSPAEHGTGQATNTPSESPLEAAQSVTTTPPKTVRKVLGDKSVNMSPLKASLPADKPSKEAPEKVDRPALPRSTSAAARKRRVSAIPQPMPHEAVIPTIEVASTLEPHAISLPPKTPAPPDLFSPTPSEASAARPADEGRAGTPPPSDLSTLSIATDGGMRPSRRARAAVNYAEPSLNAKIRRPSKQMVDAVTGLVDPRRAMSASTERKSSVPRTVVIKKEPADEEEEGWRDLPPAVTNAEIATASPLGPKSVESSSDPLLAADEPEHEQALIYKPSAASATISALMAGARRRHESSQHQDFGSDLAAKMKDLDIYDFKDSSSPPDDAASKVVGAAGKTKAHRRHSSVPKDLPISAPERPRAELEARTASVVESAGQVVGRSERAASRRRSMML